jgi:hypothetical protein
MDMAIEISLAPGQAGRLDELGGVAVEQLEEGPVKAVLPDLSEIKVTGDGEVTETKPAPDLGLGNFDPDGMVAEDFAQVVKQLRRPMSTAAVRWKVQATVGGKALIVPYIDARLVIDRLNTVCPGNWAEGDVTRPELAPFEFVPWGKGAMLCRLSVLGVCRQDVGEGYSTAKALISDSLKRAGVKFGVGGSLYAMPKIWFRTDSEFIYIHTNQKKEKTTYLTPQGDAELPALYTRWLWEHGVKAFGLPLDHGDSASAVGDVETGMDVLGAPDEGEAPDPEAAEAREEMRKSITKGGAEK